MKAKLIMAVFVSCAIWSQLAAAETCPTVDAIKKNNISGWKAYDSDDGTPLTAARETQFKQSVLQFALAEWATSKKQHGSIHCYYRDETGSNLEAYLAKENFAPKKHPKSFWYQVSGYMHCAADSKQCEFESILLNKQQLAKK